MIALMIPAVSLTWSGDRAVLTVEAPAEGKIAHDAPSSLALSDGDATWTVDTRGAPTLSVRAPLAGRTVEGTVSLGMCKADGTECQPGTWSFRGALPDRRKGALALDASGAEPAAFGPDATAEAADGAFARAKANGRAVLLDFSAVWCPPCNLLAAEVLHGEPAAELDAYEVAMLDVDHPSSFPLKDRYNVGGYPTLVVVDANGDEKARHLGYTTREELLGWLASAVDSREAEDLRGSPDAVSPARAAALGLAVEQGGGDARPWLARASSDPTAAPVDLHLLRFLVEGAPADLEWLVANAPGRAADYAYKAVEVGGPAARAAVDLEIRAARGPTLSVALDHAATLAPADEQALWYAAAAAALRSALTGDRDRDRGYITDLSWLLVKAGDGDAAVALLSEWSAANPGDPTFDLALARRLIELRRYEAAVAAADRALASAWGDNHLRCAAAKAEALFALGRADEAKAVASAELAAQPAPAEDQVRTHRYRKTLEALAAGRAP